jgi:type II secretory pathway pseudopilin PulG
MTLLEVLIAVAITSLVMSMAVSVVGSGVKLARQQEQTVNSNEAARTGMEMLLRDLRAAGVPQGIWVTEPGGTPIKVNSIFTQAGTGTADTGIDDLWMVVPRPNALQSNCTSPGSGAVVEDKSAGTPLPVTCTAPFATTDILMVTNFGSAALISGLTFGANTISSLQAGTPGFSSRPDKGGFQKGDLVIPVDIVRYQVRLNPILTTTTSPGGRPELIRSRGALNSPVSAAAPFAVPAGSPEQRFPDVDDLQVAFGSGTAPNLTFVSAHNVLFNAATSPLAVRVSVVGITPRPLLDDQNKVQPYGPVNVENHVPTPAVDGYRRSIYRRRVELLNMGIVNL